MPQFSKTSVKRLLTCHPSLQDILTEAIKETDFTIVCGFRNQEDQTRAFKGGQSKLRWPMSKHNKQPSQAVDIAPYPIDWNDHDRFIELAKIILRIAKDKRINIRWGGDWDNNPDTPNRFSDLPHFELA
jgi:peptidoglycan LD-endopeptidase CwlK